MKTNNWYWCLKIGKNQMSKFQRLLKKEGYNNIPPEQLILDHMTILHASQKEHANWHDIQQWCEEHQGRVEGGFITHIGESDKAIAFAVNFPNVPCANLVAHVTVATKNNGKPVDSNFIKSWRPIEKRIALYGIVTRV